MIKVGMLENVAPDLHKEIRNLIWMKETLEEVEYAVDEYDHRANVSVPDEYVEDVISGILTRKIKSEEGWTASIVQKNSGRVDLTIFADSETYYSVRNARCLAEGLLDAYMCLRHMVGVEHGTDI